MEPAIIDIPGIGPAAVAALAEHGIDSLADLARASVEEISAIPGFSEARAAQTIAEANKLLPAPDEAPPVKDTTARIPRKDRKDEKGKGKGKGKGKKKDKKNKGKKKSKGKEKRKKKNKK
jgi:hypothetical protein